MLSKLSLKYNLSQRYTNHSLRVTGLQALEDANFEGRHIIRISGHKSEQSIKNYARKLSAARKRNISSVLSSVVDHDKENATAVSPKIIKLDQVVPVLPSSNLSPSCSANISKPTTTSSSHSLPSISSDYATSDDTLDFTVDSISLEDDDFFSEIPNNLLYQNNKTTSLISASSRNNQPIFHNCNVTINYNYNN